jgi:U3 small nucleolar RNA-associated protein 25
MPTPALLASASAHHGARASPQVPLLLYSERAHFFRRHKLSGARHLAVYSPPTYAHFYTELLQQLSRSDGDESDSTCALLFCKLDAYPLQRLVGTERAASMLSGNEACFLIS